MIGMPPLVFDNGDPKPIGLRLAEINYVRKPRQHGPPKVAGEHHPSFRRGGDPQNHTLKLINELVSQARHPLLIIIPNRFEFAFDSRVVFNGHRSLAIISLWVTAWTWPCSICRSRSNARVTASASSNWAGTSNGSSKLSQRDPAKNARSLAGRRNASEAI